MALANVKKKRTSQQEQQQQQPQDPFPHKLELSAKKYDPTKLGPWVKDTFPGNHQIEVSKLTAQQKAHLLSIPTYEQW